MNVLSDVEYDIYCCQGEEIARLREELRRTKRALCIARAERARASWNMWRVRYHYNPVSALQELSKVIMDKWHWVELKCWQKAEEYK